ncbi:MAG: pilus assembly protein TadG-related protein [Actinomycetota bacterium]
MGRRLRPRRDRLREQDGAVVVIVALCIVALIGVASLVVDLGGVYFRRVALQNSADAAALAAANACGTNQGVSGAEDEANYFTNANSEGAIVEAGFPTYAPMCDSPFGEVTVQVVQEQPVFFAGVFGSDGDTTVRASATAQWGGAGAFEHVAPLMISADRLHDCDIPPEPNEEVIEQICTFFWDNSSSNPNDPNPALTNAEWGTLDLNNWDVATTVNCNQATPPEFEQWMFQGFPGELPITPPETYVCRGQGNFGNSLNMLIEDAIDDELSLYFPVNDPLTQVDRDGFPCQPGDDCSVDKYNILGFARLTIVQLWSGKQEAESSPCAERLPDFDMTANSRCMQALWTDYSNEGLDPSEGENFGLVPVRLIE